MATFPSCDTGAKCAFAVGPGVSTAAYYPPVYDRNGVNMNPDRNLVEQDVRCVTCGKQWTRRSKVGDVSYVALGGVHGG